jgi:hypothetical protein
LTSPPAEDESWGKSGPVGQWPLHMEIWVSQALKIRSFLNYSARDVVRVITTRTKVLRWG